MYQPQQILKFQLQKRKLRLPIKITKTTVCSSCVEEINNLLERDVRQGFINFFPLLNIILNAAITGKLKQPD